MGMTAHLLAMGKFSQEVKDHLEYPPAMYDNTKPGKLVFGVLFLCNTTSQSMALADILGVTAWDFNSHLVEANKIAPGRLLELLELPDGAEDLGHFDALLAAGFRFVYRPNG